MKRERLITIIIFFMATVTLLCPVGLVSAQTHYCIIKKDIDVSYEYQLLKAKILGNAPFEIMLTVEEGFMGEDLEIKLLTSGTEGDFLVSGRVLLYYLGTQAYGLTKTDYEILGPETEAETDIPIPSILSLFTDAKLENQSSWSGYNWDDYTWDANASIKEIRISSNSARIKYIEFLNDLGEAHSESQHFIDYNNFDETGWENLTLTTGAPVVSTDDDVLILRLIENTAASSFWGPSFLNYSYYPPYYSPGYPFSYSYTYFPYGDTFGRYESWNYPGSFHNFYSTLYTPLFPSGWSFGSLLNSQFVNTRNNVYYNPYKQGYNPFGGYGYSYFSNPFGGYRPFSSYFTGIY